MLLGVVWRARSAAVDADVSGVAKDAVHDIRGERSTSRRVLRHQLDQPALR